MKKIFWLPLLVVSMSVSFADEAVLFDFSKKQDVLETGYDWIENARAVGLSGLYVPGNNLYNPIVSEKYGLAIRTDAAPRYEPSNFAIEFVNPTFNEPNAGVGYITNAAAIREMEIVLTMNRGYDEVTVVWEQNGIEHRKKFKASDSTAPIESMIEFTAHVNFDDYVADVKNRNVKQYPIAGIQNTSINLKRIQITTHMPSGDWMYSPVAIVGIKTIKVIYDKAVTEEAFERAKEADDVFNVNTKQNLEAKVKRQIETSIKNENYQKALMATEDSSQNSK